MTFVDKIKRCKTMGSLEELWGGAMWINREFSEEERQAYARRRAELSK